MIVIDEDLLDQFRGPGNCERCGKWSFSRHPHHCYIKRGMGGGSRLDLRENIIGLCFMCHFDAEESPAANVVCEIDIAEREGTGVGDLFEWLYLVLRSKRMPERPWRKRAPISDDWLFARGDLSSDTLGPSPGDCPRGLAGPEIGKEGEL